MPVSARNRGENDDGGADRPGSPRLGRTDEGSAASPDLARAFDTWIAADPNYGERFGRMQALWESDAFIHALSACSW